MYKIFLEFFYSSITTDKHIAEFIKKNCSNIGELNHEKKIIIFKLKEKVLQVQTKSK